MSVVWCWQETTRNTWIPYNADMCIHIENERNAGKQQVDLGQIDIGYSNCHLLFPYNQQTHSAGPLQVQRFVTYNHPLAHGYQWFYESDVPGVFTTYDYVTMQILQDHFNQLSVVGPILDLHPQPYKIDFNAMTQTRINTGKVRRIIQKPLQTKYPQETAVSLRTSGGKQTRGVHARPSPYTKSGARSMASSVGQATHPRPAHCSFLQDNSGGVNVSQPINGLSTNTLLTTNQNRDAVTSGIEVPAVTYPLPSETKFKISNSGRTKAPTPDSIISSITETVEQDQVDPTADCPICLEAISGDSAYASNEDYWEIRVVVKLPKCDHMFHRICLRTMIKSSNSKDASIKCPSCTTIYGEKTGNCPPGTMDWHIDRNLHLAGYENYGAIIVKYTIPAGKQTSEHPNPTKRFVARGFPRVGYIPDCDKGRKLLKLLIIAFQRRLMFTIGTSITTGESNTVTWNEIHHKTECFGNHTGHGYPDGNYLDNTILELASHGVTEDLLTKIDL